MQPRCTEPSRRHQGRATDRGLRGPGEPGERRRLHHPASDGGRRQGQGRQGPPEGARRRRCDRGRQQRAGRLRYPGRDPQGRHHGRHWPAPPGWWWTTPAPAAPRRRPLPAEPTAAGSAGSPRFSPRSAAEPCRCGRSRTRPSPHGLVGPGAAIDPPHEIVDAVAPIAGTVLQMFPHAYVIVSADNIGVLVHLGLDTVQLKGEGFTAHVAERRNVRCRPPRAWEALALQLDGVQAQVHQHADVVRADDDVGVRSICSTLPLIGRPRQRPRAAGRWRAVADDALRERRVRDLFAWARPGRGPGRERLWWCRSAPAGRDGRGGRGGRSGRRRRCSPARASAATGAGPARASLISPFRDLGLGPEDGLDVVADLDHAGGAEALLPRLVDLAPCRRPPSGAG